MPSLEKLLKTLDLLKPGDLKKKKLTDEEKIKNLQIISDTFNAIPKSYNPTYLTLISKICETYITYLDENNVDIRLKVEDYLTVLFKSHMDFINRILVEIFREIKHNGSLKTLKFCLLRFAISFHHIKRVKYRAYIFHVLPTLKSLLMKQEEALYESIFEFVKLVFPKIGPFTTQNEIQGIISVLLSLLFELTEKQLSATSMRFVSQSLIIITQHSRNPKINFIYVLSYLIDKGAKNMCPPIMTWILLFTLKQFWSNFSVIFIETTPININETSNYSPSKLHVKNDLVFNKFDERNNETHIINRDAENILTLLILSWQYAILQQSSSDVNVVNAGLDLTICLMEQFVLNPTHVYLGKNEENNINLIYQPSNYIYERFLQYLTLPYMQIDASIKSISINNVLPEFVNHILDTVKGVDRKNGLSTVTGPLEADNENSLKLPDAPSDIVKEENENQLSEDYVELNQKDNAMLLDDGISIGSSQVTPTTELSRNNAGQSSDENIDKISLSSILLDETENIEGTNIKEVLSENALFYDDINANDALFEDDVLDGTSKNDYSMENGCDEDVLTLDTNLQEKIFLIQIPYPKILLPTQNIIDQDVHISILNVLYHKVLSQFILEYKHVSNENETQLSAFIKTSNTSLSKILVTIHTNSILFLGKCTQIFSLVRDFQFILPTQVTLTAKNGLDETITSKKCLLEDLLKLSPNFTDVSLLSQTCNLLAHTAVSLALIHVTGRPQHNKIESSDLQHLLALEKFCYDSLRYFLQNTNGTPHKTDLNISISLLNNPLVQSNTLLACRDLIEQLTHLAMFYDLTSNTNAEICAFIKYVTQLELSTKYWLCQINHIKLLLCMDVTFANKFVYQTKMDQLCYYINFPEGKNLAMFWIHMLIGKLKHDDFRIRSVVTHTLVDFIAKSMQIPTADNNQTNYLNIIHCLCCPIFNCQSIPNKTDILRYIITILNTQMLESRPKLKCGFIECLAMLCKKFLPISYPQPWNIITIDVNNSFASGSQNIPHSTFFKKTCDDSYLTLLSVPFTHEELMCNITLHQHIIFLVTQITTAYLYHNSRWITFSCRDPFSLHWPAVLDRTMIKTLDTALTHIFRLLTICGDIFACINPLSGSSGSFLRKHQQRSILYHGPGQRKSDTIIPTTQENTITSDKSGSPETSTFSKLASTLKIKKEQLPTDKQPSPTQHINATNSREDKYHQMFLDFSNYHNVTLYQKIYAVLARSYQNYLTTAKDADKTKFYMFCDSLLAAISQMVELMSFYEVAPIIDTILYSLNAMYLTFTPSVIKLLIQLMKSLFGTNLLYLDSDLREESNNNMISSLKNLTPYDTQDPKNFFKYYLGWKINFDGKSPTHLRTAKNFSHFNNKIPPPNNEQINENDKDIMSNHEILTNISVYIRKFEHLVIRSLKMYTITNSTELQITILDMLIQLLILRVNYRLLDSEQIFLNYLIKQIESFELGYVDTNPLLLYNLFQFLSLLSRDSTLITKSQLISLAELVIASDYGTPHIARGVYLVLIQDIFLFDAYCSWTYKSKFISPVNEENQTMRDVIIATLVKYAEQPQILELLIIIAQSLKYENKIFYLKFVKQTIIPLLKGRIGNIRSFTQPELIYQLFESVESEMNTEQIFSIIQPFCQKILPDYVNSMQSYQNFLILQTSFLKLLNAHYNIKPGNDVIDTWNNPKVKDEYLQSLWSLIYFGARIACEKQKNKSNIFLNSLHNTMNETLYDFFKECLTYFNINSVFTDNVAVRDKISTEIRNDFKSLNEQIFGEYRWIIYTDSLLWLTYMELMHKFDLLDVRLLITFMESTQPVIQFNQNTENIYTTILKILLNYLIQGYNHQDLEICIKACDTNQNLSFDFDTTDISNTLKQLNINNNIIQATPLYILKNIRVWAHLIIPLFHCDQIKDYVLKAFTYIILPTENNDADMINNCIQNAKNKPLKLLAISAWLEYINNDVLPKILEGHEISQYFNGNNSTTQSQITPLYNIYVILNDILTWKDFAKIRDLEQSNTIYEQSYHNFYVLKIFITQMFWDISSQPYTRRLVRESVFQSLKQANQYMTTFKDLKSDIKKACLKHFTLSDLILFYKKCALSTVFIRSIMGIDSLRDFITHLADKEENIFTINRHPTIADPVGNDTHGFLIYLRDVLQNAKKLKLTEAKYPCWLGSTILNLSCDDLAHLLKITDITMSQMMLVYRCFRKKLYLTILRNRINPFKNVAKLAPCFNLLNQKLVGMMREMNEIDDDIDDTIETIHEVFLILTHHPIVSKTLEFPDNLIQECALTLHKIIKTILNENRLYEKNVQNSLKILKCLEFCGHFAIKILDTNTDLLESAISYVYLILHPNVTNPPFDISMHSKIFKLVAWMVEMYTTRKINRSSCWEMSIYRTLYVLFRVTCVHNFVLFHTPINMETTDSQPIESNTFIESLKVLPFSPEAFFMDLDIFRRFSTLVIMMGWSDVSNFQEICVILTSAINRFMSHDDHLDDTPNHTLMEENNSPESPTTELERSDTPIIDTGTVDKVELVTLAIIAVRTITHLILYTTLKPNPGDPLYCEYPETCIPTCDLFKRIDIKKRYNAQLESLSLYFGLDNRKNGKFWSEEIPSWPWRCNLYPTHNMGQISLKHAWLVMGTKCVVRSSLSEADQRKLNLSSPNQGIDQDPNDTVLIALEEKDTQFSPLYHSSGCDMISILKLITDLYTNAFAFLQKVLAPNYKTTHGTRNENILIANTIDHNYKMIGDFTIPQIESKGTVRSVSRQESFMVDKIIPYRKLLLELIKSTIYISDLFSNPAQFEWAQTVFTQLYEVFNDENSSLLVENFSTGLPLSLELFLDGGNNNSGTTSKNYTSPEDKNICRDEYLMSHIAFGLCKSLASLGMSAKLCESTYAIITNVFKSSSILTKILGFKMSFYLLESNPYANEKLIQLLANHAYTLLDYLTPKTLVSHAYVDVLMKTLFYLGETFQNIPLPELTTCSPHIPIPFHDNNCDLYVRKLLALLVKNGFFALPSYIAELKNIKGIDLKQTNCSFVEHFHQIDLDRNNCRVNCQLCRLLLLNIVPEGPVLDFITAHSLSSFISITSWAHQSHRTPSILFIEPRGPLLTSYINLLSTCMFWSKLKRQNAFRNNAPNSKPLVALNNSHNYSNTVNNVGPSSHQTQALTGYIMQYTEFMISDYTDLTDNLTTQTILFDSGPSYLPGTILEFTFAADLIDKWLNRYTTSTTFPNSLPDSVNHDWNANSANLKNSLLLYYTFHHIYHKAMVENGTPSYTLNNARKLLVSDNNDNNVIRIEHDWILLGMEKILAIMSRYIQKGELETENIDVENSNSAMDVLQYNITHQFWKLITLLTADTMTDDSKSIFPYVLQRMCNPSILSGDSIDDCSFIVTQIESFFHSIRNNELKRRFIDIINGFIRTNHKINNESINLIFKILKCVNEHIQLKTDPLRE